MDYVRRLLLVLAIACSPAMADIAGYLQNRSGGLIVLTDQPCKNNTSYIAYTQSPRSSTEFGCWSSDKIMVHVLWNDGDVRSYPLSYWDFDEEVIRRMKKRERERGPTL